MSDHGEYRVTSVTGGSKGQKAQRYDLIPALPLMQLAELYGKGADKYGEPHNWRRGYDWSLSFAALNRHLWAFWNGEDMDEGTGMPHMTCVAFHAFTLSQFMSDQRQFDDRPTTAHIEREQAHEWRETQT
jgi:hypothetical protein